jgi:hypothetical protein
MYLDSSIQIESPDKFEVALQRIAEVVISKMQDKWMAFMADSTCSFHLNITEL